MLVLWICVRYIRCCDIIYTMFYYIVYTMLKVSIVGFFVFVRYEQKWFFHFHIIIWNLFFSTQVKWLKIFFEILLEIQSNIGKEIVIFENVFTYQIVL